VKLNLGCGRFPLDGFTNVDLHADEADINGDLRELEFSGVEEIRMIHLLEHFSWRETQTVLERVKGWLAPDGLLRVEVPDMQRIMKMGTEDDWLRYVYGSQQHDGEYHRSGFTESSLREALELAGFRELRTAWFNSDFETRPGMPCVQAEAKP
jgi:predicted SAM-dependent methyltransferase